MQKPGKKITNIVLMFLKFNSWKPNSDETLKLWYPQSTKAKNSRQTKVENHAYSLSCGVKYLNGSN